jgi:hypothetical protein
MSAAVEYSMLDVCQDISLPNMLIDEEMGRIEMVTAVGEFISVVRFYRKKEKEKRKDGKERINVLTT